MPGIFALLFSVGVLVPRAYSLQCNTCSIVKDVTGVPGHYANDIKRLLDKGCERMECESDSMECLTVDISYTLEPWPFGEPEKFEGSAKQKIQTCALDFPSLCQEQMGIITGVLMDDVEVLYNHFQCKEGIKMLKCNSAVKVDVTGIPQNYTDEMKRLMEKGSETMECESEEMECVTLYMSYDVEIPEIVGKAKQTIQTCGYSFFRTYHEQLRIIVGVLMDDIGISYNRVSSSGGVCATDNCNVI